MTGSTFPSPVAGEDDKASLRLDDAQETAAGHPEHAEAAPAAPAASAMPPALDTVTVAELLAVGELSTTREVATPPSEADESIAAPSLDAPSLDAPSPSLAAEAAEATAAGAAEDTPAASDSKPSHNPTEAVTPSLAEGDAPRSLTEAIDAAARLAAVEEAAIEVAAPAPASAEAITDPLPADIDAAPDAPPAMPAPVAAAGVPSPTSALDAVAAAASVRPEPVHDGAPADPDGASPAADLASAPAAGAEATAQPLTSALDAAAKLAADATAAAEALESLKRLLQRQQQGLATPAPPADGPAWAAAPPERANPKPPPLPSLMLPATSDPGEDGEPDDEPQMPVPVPRKRAPERVRFDLRGFLAGFALSWAFGVVLYLFMTAG
ncbi:MAG TPA: hypothetical protein VIV01_21285 [Hyphomicrobiaceae bacterium]